MKNAMECIDYDMLKLAEVEYSQKTLPHSASILGPELPDTCASTTISHHRKPLSWALRPQCRISKRLIVVSDSHLRPLPIRPPRQLKCPNGAEAAFERENSDCKRTGRLGIVWKPGDLRLRSLGRSPHNAERRTWRPI